LNGELVDRDEGFAAGISANDESLVVGASTTTRTSGQLNKLKEFLDGDVSDLVLLDRALTPGEVLFLAQGALEVETSSDTALAAAPSSVQIEKETIDGTERSETLTGSDDNEWFYGNGGDDLMVGLGGQDIFVFAPEQGNDTIADFDPIEDYLALRDGLQIDGYQAVDADSDGQIDDTIVRFDPGDSVTLLDVLVTEDDQIFI
ncbi:MAG: hypothetical protein AAF933_12275, partial [Pseudomonadota bacterium]